MPSLRELRSALGAFATDKNDEELLQLASTAMGVSPGRIASEYGYKPTSSGITGLRTGAAIDQYQAGLYGLGEAVTGADFFRRGRQANEFESNVALERARAQGAIGSFEEVQGFSDVPSYVGGLAIGSAPYMVEALGGGLAARGLMTGTRAALGAATASGDAAAAARAAGTLRAGQTVGGVAAAYPSAVGGILQAQREQSGETDLGSAAALGVPFAALNALGIEGALARQQLARSGISALDNLQGFSGGLARAGASGVRTGLVESGTETLQEMTSQLGRMAVDPNEAFLSDAALGRYKESAIGGALLGGTFGGVTGFGRSDQYRAPEREINLLTPEQPPAGLEVKAPLGESLTGTDPAALMANPLGGPKLTTPTLISEETDLTQPLGQSLTGTASSSLMSNPLSGANLLGSPATPLTVTPRTELRDVYGVIATPSALQFYDEVKQLAKQNNLELTSPALQSVWTYAADKPMTPSRFEKVQQLLDAAIIQARKEASSGTPISTGLGAAGSVGVGGAVVPGAVGTAGSASPVAGTVGGTTATAGAPLQQASVLPDTSSQSATVVDQGPTTRGAPGTTALVDTSDDALEIARATGNAAEIEAMREDEAGGRADQLAFGNTEMEAVIGQYLAKSKNKERDRKILQAYILARKSVPEGYKGNVAQEVGDTFGIDASRVRQIGNPELLANIAEGMGFDRNQVFTHLGIDSATKSATTELGKLESDLAKLEAKATPSKADIAKMSELSEKIDQVKGNIESGDLTSALKTLGVEGEAGEMFATLDDSREWQKASTAGSQMAVKLVGIADKIAELQTAANELKQLGLAQAEAAATERINALTADYQALTASITATKAERKQAKSEKKTEAAQKAAEEKDAAQQAEAEKLSAEAAAKRAVDRKGLAVGDTVVNPKLGTGVVKSFSGDGDATLVTVDFQSGQTKELSVKMAKLEKTNAVQVQGTAVVSVQPEAQASQGVGGQVRRAEKPASKSQVTVQGQAKVTNKGQALWQSLAANTPGLVSYDQLTKLEQDYLTDLAVRTNGKPSVAKEMGLQQLLAKEPVTIDVEARVIDETVAPKVAALPAPQAERLEKHYGLKRDSAEFLAKVKEDIVLYATKGAEAVSGAIRDIIKTLHSGVLAAAMIFNPTAVSQIESFIVIPQETRVTTQQVLAEVPAEAAMMSDAGKQAYATLIPALKGKLGNKFITIADKPSGRIFVFKADGSFVLQKKSLFGLAKGDLYKGNNDLPQNRVTPAGLFGIKIIDAAKGGSAAVTAGDYDFGKVFALEDPDAVVTFMHSVWLKEKDAPQRAAALKSEAAGDSRFSFGCINVDKETYRDLITKYGDNMDGSKLFVVPDVQSTVNDFITGNVPDDRLVREGVQPVTKTVSTPVKSATQVASAERTIVGKEETVDTAVNRVLRLTRGDTVEVKAGTLKFDGQITDEASLRRFPGVDSALSHYENNDLRHVIDDVELWMVAPDTVDFDAAIMMIDGKQTLAVRSGMLTNTDNANWAIHHELGHIADDAFRTGGIYSQHQDLNLTIQKGVVRPMGPVVKEIMQHMAENPDSDFTRSMGYPLDHSRNDTKNMTADETRMEVFAQLWAFFNTRNGNNYLADNLPLTYDFMEINDEASKQNKGDAGVEEGAANQAAGPQAQAYRGTQRITPAILRIGRPSQGVIQSNIAKLPKASRSPVRNIVLGLGDLGGAGLDYVVFTSDLVKRAVAAGLTSAQTFADALAQRRARVSEFEREIERIADGYADIEPEFKGAGRGSVNDFLFESTRTLKWGYDSGKIKADPEMAIAFNKLGPKAQKFVKDVFAHGDKILSQKKQSVLKSANSEYDAMIQAAQNAVNAAQIAVNTATDVKTKTDAEKQLAERKQDLAKVKAEKVATLKRFQTLFAIREGKPYAPIKRDGAYVVIGKSAEYKAAEAAKDTKRIKQLESDPDHYHVSFVDTKWAARTLSDNLTDQGVFTQPDIVQRATAFEETFSGEALLPALTKIRAAVDKRDDSNRSKMLNIVNQLYLEALAEGSARKSEMRRRGVAGEVDMLQSFTRQGRADANFLANVEFEPLIQDALQQMRNDRGGNRERKSEIFNELTKRYVDSLETKGNGFITGLINTASKYFLASSPAYYMQNLTQPFMMSLPALAGRHDYTKAGKALFDAYAELGPLFKDVKLFDQQFDFSKVPADVRAAITKLVNQGQIDIGLATEINEYKVDADSKLGKFAQRLNKSMRLAVQKVEATNRLSTAIAAYRLEFARTKDAEKATQYAADILTDTHGDYTAMNAPRIFNSQWGKVALQFRKFQLIQIAFYAKLLRDAFTNPAERAVAMRTLAFSLGHTAVFAGMMGLPGYAAIAAILGFFGDEDEPYDLTADMRQALGPEWADLIMRGAPTLVGVDLSGKIGAGNMLSIMPFSDADLSTTAGRAEAFGTLVGGASLGMVSRVADGMGLILSGDYYKGIERTMPKGVSDALKAGRQAAEGMTRRNGDVVLPADEVGAISAVLTGLGVPSVKETVVYERQNRMRDLTSNFQDRTTRIKNDYAKAVRENDGEGKQDAREAWQKLQRTRQENGLKPQPLSNLLKAPQEQREREKQTVGGVAYRQGQRKLAESVAEN